jgi:lipid-A-disaccharide synthase
VGHPLLEENKKTKIDLSSLIDEDKKIISIFAGSRNSETNVLLPILFDFVKLMNKRFNDYIFIFHATEENKKLITNSLKNNSLKDVQVISDDNIKSQILSRSVFAVAKSGTVSLEICNANVPSIIVYKTNMINYLIMKSLIKVKFANIINIINKKEIIPELLQGECNAKEIYNSVVYLLKNPEIMKNQVNNCNKTLNDIRSKSSSSLEASLVLSKYLVS